MTTRPPLTTTQSVTFYGIHEPEPGDQWQSLLTATSSAYRSWYLQDGDGARPSLETASRQLNRYMPELLPTWEKLTELADGDPIIARLLTLYRPPAFLPACSQAVSVGVGEAPALVRNYDYSPDLCERVVLSTAWTGRRVLGMSDCLWGLLDGMNDAGLAASLTFGGRRGVGDGFGIPVVMRYLLEVAETVTDAEKLLSRIPVHMAYNVTVLDRNADFATIFVAPGVAPQITRLPVATNHPGTRPEDPEHARRFRSVERQDALLRALDSHPNVSTLVQQFLRKPVYNNDYEGGFGTMYTAAYQPTKGVADFVWPTSSWSRGFDSPSGTHQAILGQTPVRRAPRPIDLIGARHSAPPGAGQ